MLPRRKSAFVLGALLLCGQLGAALHQAEVRHVTCEHGEHIEVAGKAATTDTASIAGTSNAHHAHCHVEPMVRDCDAPQHAVAIRLSANHATTIAARQHIALAIDYLVAPKQSPPRSLAQA